MATLRQAKTEDDIKSLTVKNVKTEYLKLAEDYNHLINLDYIFCPQCGNFITSSNFYTSNRYKSGFEHLGCKRCILEMATDYDKKTKTRTDNKEKAMKVLQAMDLPYISELYESALNTVASAVNELNRGTAWQQYIVMVKSLPQYRNKKWNDSEFDIEDDGKENADDTKIIQKTIKNGKKRFGNYSNEDLMFLETEYQDWITRYECSTKAQESIFERLAFKKWEINKATKQGEPTKDLDKTYQELLATANIQPRQTGLDALADAQTFGTLIQKWEETRPLPEIDEELKDVDNIGRYIDVFFRGHASKMLGIKNRFEELYNSFIKKFTVTPPKYDEDDDSEVIFDKIFASRSDSD